MTADSPIAALLNIPSAAKAGFVVNGQEYDYYGPTAATCETIYRRNPGHGVGNPGFTLALTPASHHAMALGQYLAGRNAKGMKRAATEAIVAAARQ